ncbi:MAG: hypothetical protein QNK37_24975 [Acidobacteriota bacterium]|nr:hypothetical protein [Acidobacteriota bacterium]
MIGVTAYSAALTTVPDDLKGMDGILETGTLSGGRTSSAAAAYAQEAVAAMRPASENLALACLCGPGGPMVSAFDAAWKRSPDGRLTGPGFAARSRRIHPFTLLRSLQNQVAAHLSITFGIQGPCFNALQNPTALAWMLPQLEYLASVHRGVLLVLAGAGEQMEEGARRKAAVPHAPGIEGAVCLLLTRDSALGTLEATEADSGFTPDPHECAAPVPMTGIGILRMLAASSACLQLVDRDGTRAALRWRRA